MSGQRVPGPTGNLAVVEAIDVGTAPRIEMSTPAVSHNISADQPSVAPGDVPMTGGVLAAIGQPTLVRIPIPGTNGLCIELSPRGWTPKGGSTSTLFFQDITGKRHLRLDYGYNVKTQTVDYHWNEGKKVGTKWGLPDHTPAGQVGEVAHTAAKYFKYTGRVLVVVGAAVDVVSIAQASRPLRRASEVVVGWAAAWVGCKVIGAGGAAVGTLASPLGTAVGGIGGCIVGGIGGYWGGSVIGGEVFDWTEGTFFTPLPETKAP